MLLYPEDEFLEFQKDVIKENYLTFLESLDNNELLSSDYDEPEGYLYELIKIAFIGQQDYKNIYTYLSNLMLDKHKLHFFKDPHTKEEIRNFVRN